MNRKWLLCRVASKPFHDVTPVYSQRLQASCRCQLNFPTALRRGLQPQTKSLQKENHGIVIPTRKKSMMLHFLELSTGDRQPFKCVLSYSPACRAHWFWIICVSTNLRRTPHFSIVRHKKALTKACSQLKHSSQKNRGVEGEEKHWRQRRGRETERERDIEKERKVFSSCRKYIIQESHHVWIRQQKKLTWIWKNFVMMLTSTSATF